MGLGDVLPGVENEVDEAVLLGLGRAHVEVALDVPDLPSYTPDPKQRNTAFIAGNPEIVPWLWETLQETWSQ